jgi:FKBP-type peptidyl-prolyl cis-trans isomerase
MIARSVARAASVMSLALVLGLSGCASAGPTVDFETLNWAPELGVEPESMRLEDGVWIRDLSEGLGQPARRLDEVEVHFIGRLQDGTLFDSTLAPGGSPLRFTLSGGQVIRGWERGIPGMREGGRRLLVVPPSLGYGGNRRPRIPPHSVLVFEIQLIRVY